MKKTGFAALLALGMAACGGGSGGDRATLVDSCVEDGTDAAACECMADLAKEDLSAETYAALVDMAESGSDDVEAAMSDIPADQQAEFMGFAFKAAMSCNLM